MEIRVDHEFEKQIPPLTEEEFRNLEEGILAAGEIYSPIIVWNGTIVDGHNRFRILKNHPELQYSVKEMDFADRGEALSWICRNQLGRRNLTSLQKKYLIGLQYKAQKMSHGGRRRRNAESSDKNDHLKQETTRQRLAREHGVSEAYIQHCADYAEGVASAESIRPGLGKRLTTGEIKVTQGCIEQIPKLAEEERAAYIEQKVTRTSAPGTGRKKKSPGKPEIKINAMLDDEIAVAIQTALEEFTNTWEEIFESKEDWIEEHQAFCVYMIGKCVMSLEKLSDDYLSDFFDNDEDDKYCDA